MLENGGNTFIRIQYESMPILMKNTSILKLWVTVFNPTNPLKNTDYYFMC